MLSPLAIDAVDPLLEQLRSVRIAVAIVVGVALAYTLYGRLFATDDDPSITLSSRSDAGTASVLISGVHVTMLYAGILVAVTWPLVLESTAFGAVLGLAVVVHWFVARRERGEAV
ncbi:hypothetical protein [Haloplanus salinarum]|uniref:hypothetical protein n=1 Tax=Haloplanus salinarum TaxID=1912324 RepID=UPI00214BCD48|nr:hypothetical protein [Haloplanus salinarum]